jgi:two-component system cell cycle sensor histidine kinase PleC
MARANAASGDVRAGAIMGVARSMSHPLHVALRRFEEPLRLAITVLVVLFAVTLSISCALLIGAKQDDAERAASDHLDITSLFAARELPARYAEMLARADAGPPDPAPLHLAVNRLAAHAKRHAIVSSADGAIIAADPPLPAHVRTLVDALGEAQPLTTFAERAGVIKVSYRGAEALATVRNLEAPLGQIALVQPLPAVTLASQSRAQVWVTLVASSIFVLALLTAAFLMQTGRAHAADVDCERVRDRIDAALNSGRCGLWDWDLARGAIYWSNSMYALLGYERGREFLSFGDVNALIHPDDADLYDLAKRMAAGDDTAFTHDFRIRDAEGRWVWLRARAERVIDRTTGAKHLVGIAVDVTEEKRVAALTATADMRLRDAIETISEAFVLWDEQQRLVTCNSKFQNLHGLPADALKPGTPYETVMRHATPPVIAEDMLRESNPATRSRLSEVKLADGRWLQISERRTKDGGSVSVGTDITLLKEHEHRLMDSERQLMDTVRDLKASRRQLEAQAQALADLAERYLEQKAEAECANRAKTDFLSNMSHDLRTPLNAIIGFSDVMASGMFGSLGCERHMAYCKDIKASGEHLLAIVNDILDMSELEAGRVTIQPQRLGLAALIDSAIGRLRPSFAEKGIAVSISAPDDVAVMADANAVRHVLTNILQNAAKFTPSGGHVSVRVRPCGDALNIYIADDGIGIPAEMLPRLGRPFEQVEGGETARSHKGSGLGLAISRALCELHGGSLRLRSQVGVGTLVMARLPIAQPLAGAAARRAA